MKGGAGAQSNRSSIRSVQILVAMLSAFILASCTNRGYMTQYGPTTGSTSNGGVPAGWNAVGSAISASSPSSPLLAVGPGQTLYLAYSETAGTTTPTTTVYVKKFNGSSWVDLAGTVPQLGTPDQLLVDSSSNVYLFFSGSSPSVQEYNGTSWAALGNFPAVNYGASLALGPSGVLYAAFADPTTGSAATCVKWQAGAWAPVGSAGFTGTLTTSPVVGVDSSGNVYVAYQDYTNASRANVMEYTGGTWTQFGGTDFTAGTAMNLGLSVDASSGAVYVAYIDPTANRVPKVMSSTGNTWTEVGGGPITSGYSDFLYFPNVGGSTLVAGVQSSGTFGILTYSGSQWTGLGGAFSTFNFGVVTVGSTGTVYVAYIDNQSDALTVVSQ